ncbi:hypothetical protein BS47DRAFT_1363228 [Hydnum rufescens UP504]|uniref:Uncharacterized protein n=1 Tax=Hydnum rufescens UP504 TaxID=1448309 RepID=A0A9P6AUQ1_9AGAM|nr:hypothetical protein BS47DRAFT_1363228 [Hydnum rufescens UP504]
MVEVAHDCSQLDSCSPQDHEEASDSDSSNSYFTRTMSPLPPDTDPLEYGNQFLKPRSALGLSLSGHDGTSKHETNDRQGTGPPQTSSFSLHPHLLDHKLSPLAWVQSLVQKGHPLHPKPDENIKAGNGHAPGPELSSGSESHSSSNGQPIPLANSSNSDSIKMFVDQASQNGISVNGNGARKLVYPEQSSNLHSFGNDEQATMSCDPRKTCYHYQGSVGPRGGHTTHFPVNTPSIPPVYPGWRPSLPTLEGEALDSSTAATEPNPWEEAKSPQSPVHPPRPQGFQPSPNLFDRPSNQVTPTGTGSLNKVSRGENHCSPPLGPKRINSCDLAEHERQVYCQIREFDQRRKAWEQIHAWNEDSLEKVQRDVEESQKAVVEDRQSIKEDRVQVLQSVQCSADCVIATNNQITNQLSSLATFTAEFNCMMDTIITVPVTSSTTLGVVIRHLGFIVQEHDLQSGPTQAFALYQLIAPPLKYLLLTLQKHEHLGIIPEILPPPEELSWFSTFIRNVRNQLTQEELAAAPGLVTDFESKQYLLSVTPQDPLTPPLSPSFTPSDTDSSKVEIILKGEPKELPTLDPEAIHEAPVRSNLS